MAIPEIVTPPEAAQTNGKLISSQGTWSGEPHAYSFQWRKNGTNIYRATSASYEVGPDDGGEEFDCVVTARNADGEGWTISNSITASVPPRSKR